MQHSKLIFPGAAKWRSWLGAVLVCCFVTPTIGQGGTTGLGTSDSTPVYTWRIRDAGGAVLREYKSEFPAAGAETLTWQRDYVHAEGRLLASDGNGSSIHLGTLAYHTDHLGTPRIISDAGGVVSEHHYLPFGEEITAWTDQIPLKFTGHERDFPDLDYMRARYYNPSAGRFLSVDPADDGWNLYAYVGNNPINANDPTGLQAAPTAGKRAQLALMSWRTKDGTILPFPNDRVRAHSTSALDKFDRSIMDSSDLLVPEGVQVVVTHSSPTNGFQNRTPQELAELAIRDGVDGSKPILLIACAAACSLGTSSGEPLAQGFVDAMFELTGNADIEVIAPVGPIGTQRDELFDALLLTSPDFPSDEYWDPVRGFKDMFLLFTPGRDNESADEGTP